MYRLLEILINNDVFMSFRPDSANDSIVFTFRKTKSDWVLFNKSYRMTNTEINNLDVNIAEVLIDFAKRFIKEFNEEDKKCCE